MRICVTLNIADSARVDDTGSPLTWIALHLRLVALAEASRCRYPDMIPFVLRYLGLSRRFRSSASLHTNMSVKLSSIPRLLEENLPICFHPLCGKAARPADTTAENLEAFSYAPDSFHAVSNASKFLSMHFILLGISAPFILMNNRLYSAVVKVGAIRPMSPGHSEHSLWKSAPCCKNRSNWRRLDSRRLLSKGADDGDNFITSLRRALGNSKIIQRKSLRGSV